MQVVVDNLLTVYQQVGNGDDVLLIHGWGDSSTTFNKLTAIMSGQHRLTTLDLPGFGGTQPPYEVWGLENYAQFVGSFCKKLDFVPRIVVGHSNGGAVAVTAVSTGAISPEKLVLLASSGVRDQQKIRRFLLKCIAKTGKVLLFWLPARYKKRLQVKLYGAAGSDINAAPQLQETFKKTVRQDIQQVAQKIHIPTLLIYGENDTATPPAYGELLSSAIAGSSLKVLPEASHFVHHDQPKQVAQLIEDFLK